MALLGYGGQVRFALELQALRNFSWPGATLESRFP
jgi:hypothetical protein